MPDLHVVREEINAFFDILDLLVVRSALLSLAILGAYSLLRWHQKGEGNYPPGGKNGTQPK
jgi:hypothetical protein